MALAMSVSGPEEGDEQRVASDAASLLSSMISRAPGESTGVASSGNAGRPRRSATVT